MSAATRKDGPGAFEDVLREVLAETRALVDEADRGGQPDIAALVASRQRIVDRVASSDGLVTEDERRLARELAALDASVLRAIESQRRAIAAELGRVAAARRSLDANATAASSPIRIATVA